MADLVMQKLNSGIKEVKAFTRELWTAFRPYARYVLIAMLVYIVLNPSKISELSVKVYDFFENLIRNFMAWLNKIAATISNKLMPADADEEKDLFEIDPKVI